jgi:tetratricopeptide (TPR) repeat protein
MSNAKGKTKQQWTQKQAVVLSLACLTAGICGGLLIHGSGETGNLDAAKATDRTPATGLSPTANDSVQMKMMADSQASPLIAQLKSQPENAGLLTSVGNLYYDAKQYQVAVDYYERALKANPLDISVRTDMGTGYWYMGNADKALEEFNQVLSTAPNNPNTLFNRGMVKWQGRKDAAGALADWQKLLAANPDYPAKSQVDQMIAQVKSQGKR